MERHLRPAAILLLGCTPLVGRAEAAPLASPDLGGSVLHMLLGLAAVVGLIFASLWLLKRLSGPRGTAASVLRIVGGTAVGPRERVVLVEIGDTWLVLGVAPGRVSALHRLPKFDFASISEAQPAPTKDFGTFLQRFVERKHGSQ